ncbi:unnamed protein product [Lepeophtheirus salmonis]|uniref:(salmon louse) hypothetical protein n=2 Tax=Lepeophtheirus salmonis TaxID=72036 RepID=A0A7R8D8A6_LEPSM|nr:uncharacterized protein LOC121124242 [Lepeophtheirus salmonis]CAB4069748.1 unnamed protein product [Lepeophtheirus salmonis]CAF3033807.1 unnamed protein product [Lepeophtheirus salmonis]
MNSLIVLSSFLLIGVLLSKSEAQTVLKAAAPASTSINDCFCQCSSLTFRDRNNRVNGNCRTTFQGAQWCYITDEAARNGDCPDAQPSRRQPGKQWSFFSCATPTVRQCVNNFLSSAGCNVAFGGIGTRINLKSSSPQASSIDNDPDAP